MNSAQLDALYLSGVTLVSSGVAVLPLEAATLSQADIVILQFPRPWRLQITCCRELK